jgi:GPH family glycoside/pentoside/hexuronide:cation symporter
MTEKKYLNWGNKIGYGSGDIAGNVVYALLSAFVMIFLTDTVGMNSGIVGTLIAVSKLFDGVSDIFFGSLIDKTHTKMGKARPWMFYGYFGCAICLVAIFCIPADISATAQYAWFFIAYTLLNAGFYTANNIAYSALTALITKNNSERVQMGSIRFMFAFGTSMLIQAVTVDLVAKFGGGAAAWRTVAIIYAIIGVISNSLSVLSVKELSVEELAEGESEKQNNAPEEKYTLMDAFKLLVHNKYFLMICAAYLLMQLYSATLNMGIYFMKYVLGNEALFGRFAWAINIPMIAGLVFTPALVAKFKGMYKLNIMGYTVGTLGRAGVVLAGYMGNVPLMMVFTAVAAIGMSPLQGDMNALIATTSEYTYLTTGKRVDGTMYSCTSFGTKVGGGIGTALTGWLLALSGYVNNAAAQTASCVNMLHIMYLWLPMIFNLVITFVLIRLNVEKANENLRAAKK